jgi:hypothetical protein
MGSNKQQGENFKKFHLGMVAENTGQPKEIFPPDCVNSDTGVLSLSKNISRLPFKAYIHIFRPSSFILF